MRAVIKVSGKLIEDEALLEELAGALSEFQDDKIVVVHGGGPAISSYLERLGIEPKFHAGQRVTDAATLEVAEMVLSGKMGKTIVAALVRHRVSALGLSGRDAGLLEAVPVGDGNGKLGLVGEIRRIRIDLLESLCDLGLLPVISPISAGPNGRALNVNADWAAAKIAAAWRCDWLLFFGDTPGVLAEEELLAEIDREGAKDLIQRGLADRGMIPKLEAALYAASEGVGKVGILSWQGKDTLQRLFRKGDKLGTWVRV